MKFKKETKGAVQYEEDGFPNAGAYKLGTLYIRKTELNGVVPKAITVTVEW